MQLRVLLQHARDADSLVSISDISLPLKGSNVDAAQPRQSVAVLRRGFDQVSLEEKLYPGVQPLETMAKDEASLASKGCRPGYLFLSKNTWPDSIHCVSTDSGSWAPSMIKATTPVDVSSLSPSLTRQSDNCRILQITEVHMKVAD